MFSYSYIILNFFYIYKMFSYSNILYKIYKNFLLLMYYINFFYSRKLTSQIKNDLNTHLYFIHI